MESNDKEQLEAIYINKIRNLVGVSIHGLFENLVYLFENKDEYDDKKEFDNIIKKYLKLLDFSTKSTDKELDELILKCVLDRKTYKEKALQGLYGSYNLDFNADSFELVEKANDIFDEKNMQGFSDDVSKDYLISLIDEELDNFEDFDNFTLAKMSALTALSNQEIFEKIVIDNIKNIPENLIETFLNNSKIKIHAITKTFKQKEFKNAPLTTFDFYSSLFTIQNQMIVCLTFFDEIRKKFADNLIEKDSFFTLKKVLIDNDEAFLENIVEKNEFTLDELIEENDAINYEIKRLSQTNEAIESNYLHKYVDFLEEVLFDDLHYFMQSIENATMGVNVSSEVLATIDNLAEPTMSVDECFKDYFKFIYKNEKKLTYEYKLIFYKTILSLIFSQLIYIKRLDKITLPTEKVVESVKELCSKASLEEVKLLTAYILE